MRSCLGWVLCVCVGVGGWVGGWLAEGGVCMHVYVAVCGCVWGVYVYVWMGMGVLFVREDGGLCVHEGGGPVCAWGWGSVCVNMAPSRPTTTAGLSRLLCLS